MCRSAGAPQRSETLALRRGSEGSGSADFPNRACLAPEKWNALPSDQGESGSLHTEEDVPEAGARRAAAVSQWSSVVDERRMCPLINSVNAGPYGGGPLAKSSAHNCLSRVYRESELAWRHNTCFSNLWTRLERERGSGAPPPGDPARGPARTTPVGQEPRPRVPPTCSEDSDPHL